MQIGSSNDDIKPLARALNTSHPLTETPHLKTYQTVCGSAVEVRTDDLSAVCTRVPHSHIAETSRALATTDAELLGGCVLPFPN